MDLDIEMGDAIDAGHDAAVVEQPQDDDILGTGDIEEPGEVAEDEPNPDDDSKTLVPSKLHIRGVDTLHTDDIKAYVKAHYGPVDKVEWIDDTSANLVFASEPSARDAIASLSTIAIADPTALAIGETLPAKPVDGRPEISLQVRFAVLSDRKQAGAAQRSRYYLLHPEHDPEEKRRRHHEQRSRYRDRDGEYRRSEGGRRRRDSDEQVEHFEASMYDDAPRATRERRDSGSDSLPQSYANENRGKELFTGRSSGRERERERDRSASPGRDRNRDRGEDLFASSSRNRTQARSIKNRITQDNELFPSKSGRTRRSSVSQLDRLEDAIGSAHLRDEDRPKILPVSKPSAASGGFSIKGMAGGQDAAGGGFTIKGGAAKARELFPTKLGGTNAGKELFDGARSKPRQRAEDLFS